MGKPSYDEATLAAYFRPLSDDLADDPVVGAVIERLQREDPDLVAAVADVDRAQIRDALGRDPDERLRVALALASTLREMRGGGA